jgi:hypothetical protein
VNQWDTEQVLAFVYDVRPWRDLDDGEKAEWVRRVKHVRDNVTTDGQRWTTARLAALFGLKERGLEQRFTTSEAQDTTSRDNRTNEMKSLSHARSSMRNADISPDHKASIVAEADAETKRAIIQRLAGDPDVQSNPDVVRQVERSLHSGPRLTPPKSPEPTLSEAWHAWLNKINAVLMDGARLAERTTTEGVEADVYGELGFLIYQRITERKIDAELRDLLDDAENVR